MISHRHLSFPVLGEAYRRQEDQAHPHTRHEPLDQYHLPELGAFGDEEDATEVHSAPRSARPNLRRRGRQEKGTNEVM